MILLLPLIFISSFQHAQSELVLFIIIIASVQTIHAKTLTYMFFFLSLGLDSTFFSGNISVRTASTHPRWKKETGGRPITILFVSAFNWMTKLMER